MTRRPYSHGSPEWTEFMDIDAAPLVEDADAAAVLQSLYG